MIKINISFPEIDENKRNYTFECDYTETRRKFSSGDFSIKGFYASIRVNTFGIGKDMRIDTSLHSNDYELQAAIRTVIKGLRKDGYKGVLSVTFRYEYHRFLKEEDGIDKIFGNIRFVAGDSYVK